MKLKEGGGFFMLKRNRFTDLEYNNFVESIGDVQKMSSNAIRDRKLRIYSSNLSALIAFLNRYYKEWFIGLETYREQNGSKSNVVLETVSNNTRNGLYNNIMDVKSKGLIVAYDKDNPLIGITENGAKVKLTNVFNNPNIEQNITVSKSANSDSSSSLLSSNAGMSTTTIIIIVAVVGVGLYFLLRKKK